MRRGACLVFGKGARYGVAAGAALIVASAASATESTIYPGVGIGNVKLGMTPAQAEAKLGKDFLVNERASVGNAQYLDLGWRFSSWTVSFVKQGRTFRAVRVTTTLRNQKTSKGIGPGTLWPAVVRAYPHGVCTFGVSAMGLPSRNKIGSYLEYLVPHEGGTQTIYVLQPTFDEGTQRITNYRVLEVHVRTPFVQLPEFAPDSPFRCAPGWQKTKLPQRVGAHG
jgi:hypothetical protein